MLDNRLRSRAAAVMVTLVIAASALVGCNATAKQDIVGTWRTRLTGYNNIAGSITRYDQTVTFADDGVITMHNTLPGALNDVTGRYELTRIDKRPAIKIVWDGAVDRPSELYYSFQGEKLLTSRAPESLDMSEELNVGNRDPVVYVRAPESP